MNNSINVPCELLERTSNLAFQTQHYPLHEELRALLSSPAYTGEDGLEADCKTCNGHGLIGDAPIECPDCCADDAQAIIDGLRGEVERLTGLWELELARAQKAENELAHAVLTVDQQAETIASYKSQFSELNAARNLLSRLSMAGFELGDDAATSVIDERAQQARRIGELEGLLRDITAEDSHQWALGTDLMDRIDAALSTGKDAEQ